MILRKYQLDTIQKVRNSISSGNKSIIIQASCGSGKTCMAAAICDGALSKDKRVLFLVHRRELAYQAIERFAEYGLGDEVSLIMAGEESNLSKPIQVASIATYIRRIKLKDGLPWFHNSDLVILDEAQVSISPTYLKLMEKYNSNTIKIGLTATPCR
ncbi:DEAD/DEAH box helicase family protein, partial [bacterium]|nr:DEAD/DEAH box helicase family protein [bacterium]